MWSVPQRTLLREGDVLKWDSSTAQFVERHFVLLSGKLLACLIVCVCHSPVRRIELSFSRMSASSKGTKVCRDIHLTSNLGFVYFHSRSVAACSSE